MCRHVCPVANASGHEPFTPQAKMDRLNQLRRGHVGWSEEASEPLYACTGCRQCTTACLHGNEPGLVLFSGRQAASARGVGHKSLVGYAERFRGREGRLLTQAREAVPPARLEPAGPVGYFPGCDAVDKTATELAGSLELLDHALGSTVGLACADVACAGYPLLAAGLVDMFRWHATRVAASFRPYRTVVVGCSA
jgi:Fe-S oxidoreductase